MLIDDLDDKDYEKVIFINNNTKKPTIILFRTTEKAEPMAILQRTFIAKIQSARDQLSAAEVGSFLSEEEYKVIHLQSNAYIFLELINSKGYLRSKDNVIVAT